VQLVLVFDCASTIYGLENPHTLVSEARHFQECITCLCPLGNPPPPCLALSEGLAPARPCELLIPHGVEDQVRVDAVASKHVEDGRGACRNNMISPLSNRNPCSKEHVLSSAAPSCCCHRRRCSRYCRHHLHLVSITHFPYRRLRSTPKSEHERP